MNIIAIQYRMQEGQMIGVSILRNSIRRIARLTQRIIWASPLYRIRGVRREVSTVCNYSCKLSLHEPVQVWCLPWHTESKFFESIEIGFSEELVIWRHGCSRGVSTNLV